MNKLKDAKYFNKLDFIWGHNNIWIKEGNKWKTAFLINKELFKPKIMYFGLYNSSSIFQRMMNSIFQEILYEGVLVSYINDFVIPAKTKKELEKRTIYFLKIVEKHNFCFKQSKCDFDVEEIPILGVVVGWGEVQIEKNKVKAVKKWKTPTKIKEVENFLLGFANFYWWFIKNFSYIAKPKNKIKGKSEWKWDNEHWKVFKELKDKITSQPILTLSKREEKFRVETDALGYAIEEVLFQEQEGKLKPITFLSRTMQLAERNYEIYNKELLAIVKALAK